MAALTRQKSNPNPVRKRSFPEKLFKRTPGSFKRTPGFFKRTLGSCKRTPGSFKRIPGSFERTPGSLKRTPGSFKRTPGSFKKTPGSFKGPRGPLKEPLGGCVPRRASSGNTAAKQRLGQPENVARAPGGVRAIFQRFDIQVKDKIMHRPRGPKTRPEIVDFGGLGGPGAPGTPLDRPGPPRTSIRTKNQPRRPILRPCRDDFRSVKKSYIRWRAAGLGGGNPPRW